jgi:hypothetical protein
MTRVEPDDAARRESGSTAGWFYGYDSKNSDAAYTRQDWSRLVTGADPHGALVAAPALALS